MPIVRVESSIPLPDGTSRQAALDELAACVVAGLNVKPPLEARVTLVALSPDAVHVAGTSGAGSAPWLVAHCSVIAGRDEATIKAFIAAMLQTLASVYGTDVRHARVLIQDYPSIYWGNGRTLAATAR
jgi:hypothetical protein